MCNKTFKRFLVYNKMNFEDKASFIFFFLIDLFKVDSQNL